MYNQFLRNKKTMDEDNSRLRRERNEQKESILRIERAFTYVKRQVAKLQAKQHYEPTPQPFSNNQTMPSPTTLPYITPPLVISLEFTLVEESKKIVVVPDPPIFNENGKEVLYNH